MSNDEYRKPIEHASRELHMNWTPGRPSDLPADWVPDFMEDSPREQLCLDCFPEPCTCT